MIEFKNWLSIQEEINPKDIANAVQTASSTNQDTRVVVKNALKKKLSDPKLNVNDIAKIADGIAEIKPDDNKNGMNPQIKRMKKK